MMNLDHVETVEQERELAEQAVGRRELAARLPNLLEALRRRKQLLEIPAPGEYLSPPSNLGAARPFAGDA